MRRITLRTFPFVSGAPTDSKWPNANGIRAGPGGSDHQSAPCASLVAHAAADERTAAPGRTDSGSGQHEPMELVNGSQTPEEHFRRWLSQVNEREQKILKLRSVWRGQPSLEEIGRTINVSRLAGCAARGQAS